MHDIPVIDSYIVLLSELSFLSSAVFMAEVLLLFDLLAINEWIHTFSEA